MKLSASHDTYSPGEVLLNNYLKPKGISISKFSIMTGVHMRTLRSIIAGERMTHRIIDRISAVTRTAPRYWHYMQTDWLFRKYIESRKTVKPIQPIALPWRTCSIESPGQILSREFIKPSGESYRSIERKYKVQYPLLCDIVRERKAITPLLAARLQAAFGTSTRYWLDLQTYHDIVKILETNSTGHNQIRISIEKFRNGLELRKFAHSNKNEPLHPGRILYEQFIKPSRMNVYEWHKILFIRIKELKLILAGKRKLSAMMIIKLSRVFNTDITYWIDLNNKYYSQLAEAQSRKVLRKVKAVRESAPRKFEPPAPFEFLEERFLRPMDFPRKQFLRHIGIRGRSYGDDFRKIPRINFELAIRVGQALGVAPQYFVFLQLEYSIHLQESQSHKVTPFAAGRPIQKNLRKQLGTRISQ